MLWPRAYDDFLRDPSGCSSPTAIALEVYTIRSRVDVKDIGERDRYGYMVWPAATWKLDQLWSPEMVATDARAMD